MTTNNYSKEDILAKANEISFPDSVISFFKGDLGQPFGGFPKEFQKAVLKNEKAYTDRPKAHLDPINFDKEFPEFQKDLGQSYTFLDFLSSKLYPKVFKDYATFKDSYGEVWRIPSLIFWYGMQPDQEFMVEIDQGKNILIRFLSVNEPYPNGNRHVYFKLNGQNRHIEMKDQSIFSNEVSKEKIGSDKDIGAPLPSKLVSVVVTKG